MTMVSGPWKRAFLTLILAFSLSWWSGAAAHAFLVNTSPRAGARFTAAPTGLALQFSEPVSVRSAQVHIRDAQGALLGLSDLRPGADSRNLLAALPPLSGGVYVVAWEVLAGDGHLSSGEFAFGVGADGVIPGLQDNVTSVPLPWVAGSVLVLVGLTLALGGWVSERFVWRAQDTPRAWVGIGAGLALLGSAGHLVALIGSRTDPLRALLAGSVGIPVLLALLAFMAAALLTRTRHRAWAGIPLGAGVVAVAWQGHLSNGGTFWATPLGLLHLLLAAVWGGALVHLAQVLRARQDTGWPGGLVAGVRRYAGLAGWTVGPLLLLGGLLAWPKFATPDELWTTPYGQLLIAKVAVVLVVLALAGAARSRAMPARTADPAPLARLVSTEGVALLGVLVLSAGLVNATPPQALTAANILSAPPPAGPAVRAAAPAGFLSVYVTAAEGELRVQVALPDGKPGRATRLKVSGQAPTGSFTLHPRPCGRGCSRAPFTWTAGVTTVQVQATDPDWGGGGTARMSVRWPPGPDQTDRLEKVVKAMQHSGTFTVTEQALTGPNRAANSFPLTAQTLAVTDIYMGGGAEDVRSTGRDAQGHTVLSLFVPGSTIWYELHVDDSHRIRQERVIAPGYAVERRFEYSTPLRGDQP